MSIAGILTNFIIRLVRLISNSCRRAVEFCRFGRSGAPRIAELPFVRPKEERQSFDSQSGWIDFMLRHFIYFKRVYHHNLIILTHGIHGTIKHLAFKRKLRNIANKFNIIDIQLFQIKQIMSHKRTFLAIFSQN
jgi:hypothetical protein